MTDINEGKTPRNDLPLNVTSMDEWKNEIRQRLAHLKLEPTRETEIIEELAQHLQDRYEQLRLSGATEESARGMTLEELSDENSLASQLARVETIIAQEPVVLGSTTRRAIMADLFQDLRYAARMMRLKPGFTSVVVLTLALGIGLNSVFFTLFGLAFRPLPVNNPDSIVSLDYQGARDRDGFSYPEYSYFRDHTEMFSDLLATTWFHNLVLGDPATSEERYLVNGQFVSDNFFSTLGGRTIVGRPFTVDENRTPGQDPVAVLSYAFWQTRFGGDPNMVGQTLRLNGKPFTVIGVTEPDFVGLGLVRLRVPDMWLPLMTRAEVFTRDADWFVSRSLGWVAISGRLKPDRTLREASSEMTVLAGQLALEYPDIDPTTRVVARHTAMLGEVNSGALVPMSAVLAATFMVLLIACSNIANLLLARAAARQKEIGVRLCLGASRGRIIRQLLTESLLLAILGGGAGLLLSWWSLKAFLAKALLSGAPTPPSITTMIFHLNPDARILISTTLLSFLAAVLFGLGPALRVTRGDPVVAIKDDAASFGRRGERSRLWSGLVVAQVSLSLVLLIAAGLLLHGVIRAGRIDPGLKTSQVLRLEPRVEAAGYDIARLQEFREQLATRLESIRGVRSVSWARRAPFRGVQPTTITLRGETDPAAGRTLRAAYNAVTPNYFETVGIPITLGRGFTGEEMRAGAAVGLVTESTARILWPDKNPLGQLVRPGTEPDFVEVIGVTRDAQTVHLGENDAPFIYLLLTPRRGPGELLVGTSGDALEMKGLVRDATRGLDPDLFLQIFSLDEDVANQGRVVAARLAFRLAAGIGLLAVLLAAIGLYSVMACLVSQRIREIGIRLALGAEPGQVMRLVLSQGLRLIGIGIVFGIAGGALVSRVLTSMLFGLSPFDPVAYVGVSLFLAAIALGASYLPARRAATVDPMIALRYE